MFHWDVFICHASEDKESVAKPLAEALKRAGLRVWYDDLILVIGDSIQRCIDEGLRKSQFGVVILSHNFFRKEWPQKELGALVAKERNGIKVILPLWHEITYEEIARYSPLLADRYAIPTSKGIQYVAERIKELIRPETSKDMPLVLTSTINVNSRELAVDGQLVANDVYGYVKEGRTYFPARHVALALGVKPEDIFWDKTTKTLALMKSVAGSKGVVVQLQADSPYLIV
ncbi:MAG: TIR domain-containing protein, partial [Synergistales bacterium]|nr:TIR domain-containing protein [Synergistales bacterium]